MLSLVGIVGQKEKRLVGLVMGAEKQCVPIAMGQGTKVDIKAKRCVIGVQMAPCHVKFVGEKDESPVRLVPVESI